MTKERKAAIKQWELVLERLLRIRDNPTSMSMYIFKKNMGYEWVANCWFCTYVRKRGSSSQGCERCPLFKYSVTHKPDKCKLYSDYSDYCGCTGYWSLYVRVRDITNDINDRIAACKLIIQALYGKHIWTYNIKEE